MVTFSHRGFRRTSPEGRLSVGYMVEKSDTERRVEELELELEKRQAEFDELSLEMALSVSEFFQVLRELTRGNYSVRAGENSQIEVFAELGKTINTTIANIARSEEALRQSEERFRNLAEMLPVAIFETDLQGNYTFVNREASHMTGYSLDELYMGLNGGDLVVPEDLKVVLATMAHVLNGEVISGVEYRSLRKDGSVFPSLAYAAPIIQDGKLSGMRGLVVDISDKKKAEEESERLEAQVQHSQKLESLGVLAGGIAHDFNNLLTGILGNAELAMRHLPPASPCRDFMVSVGNSADRAAELCRQMLAYSGKGRFILGPLDLRREIDEMLHLMNVLISKKVTLKLHFPKELPVFEGDGTQIRQVIMNLVINASEAIGDQNGVVTINLGSMDCDTDYLVDTYLDESLEPGEYVYLEVSDSGCGMDAETQTKIFDPFFSTKFTGRGLGLSAVLGIVRGHGGAMKVYSEPDRGSTFKVLFPVAEGEAEGTIANSRPEKKWSGSGTVLLVDDDDTVQEVGRAMLAAIGFDVILACDGADGLEKFRANSDIIDCVILDLTMPNMDGREAFREIRRVRSDVPIILSSGYNEQEIVNEFTGKKLAGFIQKPYRLSDMIEKLRGALGEQE